MKKVFLALSLFMTLSVLLVSCTTAKSSTKGGCVSTKGMIGYR